MTTFYNLAALNTATKYPSIPTYHDLGPGGYLQESGNPFKDHDGPVYVTEKIDGTNGRIIICGGGDGDWYIGSREHILTASGDRVANPALRIVDALKPLAMTMADIAWAPGVLQVFYFEVYGDHNLPGWKVYGDGTRTDIRLFDHIVNLPESILAEDVETIARWRDQGGQPFANTLGLQTIADVIGVSTVPTLAMVPSGAFMSDTVDQMHEYMTSIAARTKAAITPGQLTQPEGIVLRTADRSIIRKARYQSYDRTLGARKSGK